MKEGQTHTPINPFEWLTNFSSLAPLLSKEHLFPKEEDDDDDDSNEQEITKGATLTHDKDRVSPNVPKKRGRRQALHVGCGSSTLGEGLVEHLGYDEVMNVDCDMEVLEAMQRRWDQKQKQQPTPPPSNKFEDHPKEEKERGIMKFQCLDFAKPGHHQSLPSEFDLVVDKSTLDCALCSDHAAAGLIVLAHNALLPNGGVYVVITFHHVDFIRPLLELCPGVDWNVEHCVMERQVENIRGNKRGDELLGGCQSTADMTPTTKTKSIQCYEKTTLLSNPVSSVWSNGSFEPSAEYGRTVNVFVCKRRGTTTTSLDWNAIKEHIHRTNDEWFKLHNPMVTHTRETDLRRMFTEALGSNGQRTLSLRQCYQILFTDAEREHLSFDLFLEDWHAYLDELPKDNSLPTDSMTVETAIHFLEEMQ